jgi:hypothetical protein
MKKLKTFKKVVLRNENFGGDKLNIKKVILSTILMLTFVSLLGAQECFAQLPPNAPEDDNALWFEPSWIYLEPSDPVGTKFNITLWAKSVNQSKGWQFWMVYDKTYINASRTGLTAGDTSEFYQNITTIAVAPDFKVDFNATHNRLDYGEAWIMGDPRSPGYGSLCWIEFEVVASLPTEYVEIPIAITYGFRQVPNPQTYILYVDSSKTPLTVYDGVVVIPELSSLLMLAGLFALATPILLHTRKKNG